MANALTVGRRPRRSDWRLVDRIVTFMLSTPALVVLVVLTLYPLADLAIMSMRDYGSSLVRYDFVGLKWYAELLHQARFLASVGRTVTFTSSAVLLQLVLGMGMALVLNRDFGGIKIVRTLLLLPMVAMPVASAMMWSILYHPSAGVLNWLLQFIGMKPSLWLAAPQTVLFPSLLIIEVWLGSPFAMLIILAGLRTLPEEPFEAAQIDGASALQRFWYLTLPLVRPALMTAMMFRLIDTLKQFAVIFVLTGGGPVQASETIYVYGYIRAFKYMDLGQGSAILLTFVLLIVAVSALALRAEQRAD